MTQAKGMTVSSTRKADESLVDRVSAPQRAQLVEIAYLGKILVGLKRYEVNIFITSEIRIIDICRSY